MDSLLQMMLSPVQNHKSKTKSRSIGRLQYEVCELRLLMAVGNLGFTGWQAPGEISSTQTMGTLANAFNNSPESSQWEFWWNAPTGWVAGGTQGNLTTGKIGDINSYRPLKKVGTTNVWTVDGDSDPLNSPPAQYLQVSSTNWHPGLAYPGSSSSQDRFAIASFKAQKSGFYKFKDLALGVSASSWDGVELYVHVEHEFRFNQTFSPGSTGQFSNDIGYVGTGDRIFIAVGGFDNYNSDTLLPGLKLERVLPREAPDTDPGVQNVVEHTLPIGITPEQATTQIQTVINGLLPNQRVLFKYLGGSVLTLNPSSLSPPDQFFNLSNKSNVEIDFGGLELRLNDRGRGFFLVLGSSNAIIKNAKIDYTDQELPFTQGTIISPIGSNYVDFQLSSGFVEPVSFTNPSSSDFNNQTSFQLYAYPVSKDGSGQIIEASGLHYTGLPVGGLRLTKLSSTGNTYRLNLANYHSAEGLSGLSVGDGIVVQARSDVAALFGIYGESNQITLSGITAWAAPTTFVASVASSNINVMNCNIEIRTGRWKSINADAVHIQSSRLGGAWVENSKFNGVGDDVMNFYTSPLVFTGTPVFLDGAWQVPVKLSSGPAPGFSQLQDVFPVFVKVGDKFTIYDPLYGTSLATGPGQLATVVGVVESGNKITHLRFSEALPDFNTAPSRSFVSTNDTDVRDNWMLFNRTVSKNFVVEGNDIRNSKRHGIYLMASRSQILDNTFSGLAGQSVVGRNESGWPFGAFASETLVQGNTFSDNGHGRVTMNEDYQSGDVSFHPTRFASAANPSVFLNQPWYYHQYLELRDNVFYHWRKAAISVRNSQLVNIVGNTILAPQKYTDLQSTDEVGVNYNSNDPNRNYENVAIRLSYSTNGTVADNYTADLTINQATLPEHSKHFYNTSAITEFNSPTANTIPNVAISNLAAWFKFDRRLYNSRFSGIVTDSSIDSVQNVVRFWDGGTQRTIGGTSNADPLIDHYSGLGKFEYGAYLDGINDGVSIDLANNLSNLAVTKRTVGLWVNMDATTLNSSSPRLVYEEGTTARGFNVYVKDQKLVFGAWDTAFQTFLEAGISTGWRHVAFVLDVVSGSTTDFRAYIDGVLVGAGDGLQVAARSENIGVGMNSGTTRFKPGTPAIQSPFKGHLDDLRIYNRALSQAEIAALALKRFVSAWPLQSSASSQTTPPPLAGIQRSETQDSDGMQSTDRPRLGLVVTRQDSVEPEKSDKWVLADNRETPTDRFWPFYETDPPFLKAQLALISLDGWFEQMDLVDPVSKKRRQGPVLESSLS